MQDEHFPDTGAPSMITGGVLMLAWTVVVWQWQDPFTAAYTKYEQHQLARSYAHKLAEYRAPHYPPAVKSRLAGADRPHARRRPA